MDNIIVLFNLMRVCTLHNVGHENNVHCLAIAVNAIAGAVFAFYGEQEQKDRMKDFIIVSTYQLNISKMI